MPNLFGGVSPPQGAPRGRGGFRGNGHNRGGGGNRGQGRGRGAGGGGRGGTQKRGRGSGGGGYNQTDARIHGLGDGRPYLRKIKFIQSSVVLFQDQEEIFEAEIAEINAQYPDSSIPTADQVNALVHHDEEASDSESDGDGTAEDENWQEEPSSEDVEPMAADDSTLDAAEVAEHKDHAPDSAPLQPGAQQMQDQMKKAANKQRKAEWAHLLSKAVATGRKKKKKKKDVDMIATIIKEFVEDDQETTLKIPEMTEADMAVMNKIATAYNLNSGSKRKGKIKTVTLSKTPKTGVDVNNKKLIAALQGWGAHKAAKSVKDGGPIKGRHREGAIVDQHAAKIDESNVGYRLLQTLGWSAGDTIGVTGGLEAPLEAVFKSTKRGLGAGK